MIKILNFGLDNLIFFDNSCFTADLYHNNKLVAKIFDTNKSSLHIDFKTENINPIIKDCRIYFDLNPKHFSFPVNDSILLNELINDLIHLYELKKTYIDNFKKGFKILVCLNFVPRNVSVPLVEYRNDLMVSLHEWNEEIKSELQKEFNPVNIYVYDSIESIAI